MGEPKCTSIRAGCLLALIATSNIEFKFYISTFGRNGRKKVNGMVKVNKGSGMPASPMDPQGNFPPRGFPKVTKSGCQKAIPVTVANG